MYDAYFFLEYTWLVCNNVHTVLHSAYNNAKCFHKYLSSWNINILVIVTCHIGRQRQDLWSPLQFYFIVSSDDRILSISQGTLSPQCSFEVLLIGLWYGCWWYTSLDISFEKWNLSFDFVKRCFILKRMEFCSFVAKGLNL